MISAFSRAFSLVGAILLIPALSYGQEYVYGLTANGGANGEGVAYRLSTVEQNDFAVFADLWTRPASYGSTGMVQFGPRFGGERFGFVTPFFKHSIAYDRSDSYSGPVGTFVSVSESQRIVAGSLVPGYDGFFYGQTWKGGNYDGGKIYVTHFVSGPDVDFLHFDGPQKGKAPRGNMIIDEFSTLYGMTELGGINNKGVIFSINTSSSSTFKKLLDFNGVNGANPVGSLVLLPDGYLYGMTKAGGSNNLGVVFKIAVDGTGYQKLLDFDGATTGSTPLGSLIEFTDGKLYATTSTGGINNLGTIFSITTSGEFTKIVDFDGTNGKTPISDLVVNTSGTVMYGTTYSGGSRDFGTMFQLTNGTQFQKLYDYNSTAGNPVGALVVLREKQKLEFPPIPDHHILEDQFDLVGSSPAGTPLYFNTKDANIKINGHIAVPKEKGTATVRAYHRGNYKYAPVTDEVLNFYDFEGRFFFELSPFSQAVNITKAPQTISFDNAPTEMSVGESQNLDAHASSGLPVYFKTSEMDVLWLWQGSSDAIPKNAGIAVVTATQSGNDTYAEAPPVKRIITVNRMHRTITLKVPELVTCCNEFEVTVDANPNDDYYPIVQSNNPDAATVQRHYLFESVYKVTPKKAGTLELIAYFNDPKYDATPVIKKISIPKLAQQIYVPSLPSTISIGNSFDFYPSATGGQLTIKTNPEGIVAIQDGKFYPLASGRTVIEFSQAGNDRYEPATTVAKTVDITGPSNPTSNVIAWDDINTVRSVIEKKMSLTARASSGLPIVYTSSDPGVASVSGTELLFLKEGSVTITANQAGGGGAPAATPVSKQFFLQRVLQSVPSLRIPDNIYPGNPPLYLEKFSDRGLPYTWTSSNSAIISVEDNRLNFLNGGSAVITVSQAGNEGVIPVRQDYVINLNRIGQGIEFFEFDKDKKVGDPPFELNAIASSGLPVTFVSSSPDVISIEGNIATIKKAGYVNIEAVQTGSGMYYDAIIYPSQGVLIKKGPQTIIFDAIEQKKPGDAILLTATSNTPTPITYHTTTPNIVKISGNVALVIGVGTANITAAQTETTDYLPAELSRSFEVTSVNGNYTLITSANRMGPNKTGYVFKTTSEPGTITSVKLFPQGDEPMPINGLIKASDGKLYGNTGSNHIIRLEPDGSGYTIIFKYLLPTTGIQTYCELFEGTDGFLYSTTTIGGKYNLGGIVKISKDGSTHQVVHHFNSTSGGIAAGGVMQAADGRLYGATRKGGFYIYGTIYSVNTDGSDFRVMLPLSQSTGYNPLGRPVQGQDGSLYLEMNEGGFYGTSGGLLKFNVQGDNLTWKVIRDLGGADNPLVFRNSDLLIGSDQRFYLTYLDGAYSFTEANPALKTLVNFEHYFQITGPPYSRMAEGSDGYIYGTTSGDGDEKGIVYKVDKQGTDFRVLHIFNGPNGAIPHFSGLTETTPGTFLGSTSQGGTGGFGVYYKINSSGDYTVVYDPSRDDRRPVYITSSPDGKIYYGVLEMSKPGTNGAIFSVNADGSDYKILKYFEPDLSVRRLTYASTGKLWAIGKYGDVDLIFTMNIDGTDYDQVLWFDNDQKGNHPVKLLETNGYMYGMTASGGPDRHGILFRLNLDGTEFTNVGNVPWWSLNSNIVDFIVGSDGKFYAVTSETEVCSFDKDGVYSEVKSLADYPNAKVIIELNNGDLAISTEKGGENNMGRLFGLTKDGSRVYPIYDFKQESGRLPVSMAQSVDGSIYVATTVSGVNGDGALLRISGDGEDVQNIVTFNEDNGTRPNNIFFEKSPQSFTFEPMQPRKFTEGPFTPAVTTNSGGIVRFTSSDPSIAVVDNGIIKPVGIGTVTITASLPENANYYAAPFSIDRELEILKGDQIITFSLPAFGRIGDDPIVMQASSSAGLEVSFTSSDPDVASVIEGNRLQLNTKGTATVTASQPGNSFYNSAIPVAQEFNVYGNGTQTITFSPIADVTVGDTFELDASASSALPVSFSATTSNILISGIEVTAEAPGRATIEAAAAGNEEYSPAVSVTQMFCINPETPVISVVESGSVVVMTSSNLTGNQWYLNGLPIADAIEQEISVNKSGVVTDEYTVITTVSGCSSDMSTSVLIVTGVDDDPTHIEFYPNPATDVLFLRSNVAGHVQILNAIGLPMITQQLQANTENSVDVSKLANGLYVVRFEMSGKIVTRKLAKN